MGSEKALDLLQETAGRDPLVRSALERSSVQGTARRGSKVSTESITSQLCSVTSGWQLEISQSRRTYTMEMGILVLFREVVVDIHQHVPGRIPPAPGRERTCGERESRVSAEWPVGPGVG